MNCRIFNELKYLISSDPVLRTDDNSLPFSLQIGNIMMEQCYNRNMRMLVCYVLFVLPGKAKDTSEAVLYRETSLVLTLKKFDYYLYSYQPVKMYTDHNLLLFIHCPSPFDGLSYYNGTLFQENFLWVRKCAPKTSSLVKLPNI